ncbi:MAG TPA: hypothetical protein VMR18_02420 [Candidatus Saccharimonadales bacterium]|nr:hypothetical protein [Candidatus Saccharimonadales bacterium]
MPSHFDAFLTTYPSVEARRDLAVKLAQNTEEIPNPDYLTHNFLGSHWGEDDAALQGISNYVYGLHPTLSDHKGKPIMVIEGGSTAEVLSSNDYLHNDFVAVCGTVLTDQPVHGYGGRLAKGPRSLGIKPPYLKFRLGVDVRVTSVLSLDFRNEGSFDTPEQRPEQRLDIYRGTVSLGEKVEDYKRGRVVQRRETVFGLIPCRNIVRELVARASRGENGIRGRLTELARDPLAAFVLG